MNKLRSPINYKSLQLELQEALREDELYRLRNDAKLRAMEQNVPTYEDFRQMVNAAHLKPLEHGDVRAKVKRSWNPVTDSNNFSSPIPLQEYMERKDVQKIRNDFKLSDDTSSTLQDGMPATYEQFTRTWRTLRDSEAKFRCLKEIRHNLPEYIFRAEIPSSYLVEIQEICLQNVSVEDNILPIVDILHSLSRCNRFSLAVTFMGRNEIDICARLFHNLLVIAQKQSSILTERVRALESLYHVELELL